MLLYYPPVFTFSAYFVGVELVKRAKRSLSTNTDALTDKNFPHYQPSNPTAYMTAKLDENDVGRQFTIGDGAVYNNYHNRPLDEGSAYKIYYGVEITRGNVSCVYLRPSL